jgi:hypothetical protein
MNKKGLRMTFTFRSVLVFEIMPPPTGGVYGVKKFFHGVSFACVRIGGYKVSLSKLAGTGKVFSFKRLKVVGNEN